MSGERGGDQAVRRRARTATQLKIFINYRREEASFPAHQLYDALVQHFGEHQVFIDVDTIEPGLPFNEVIDREVGSCDVLVAVVGRDWLTLTDEKGHRRLDKPDDWVRLEIEEALERGVRVIPALLRGAEPPTSEELPESLRPLARLQAVSLSDDARWRDDVMRLIRVLERIGETRARRDEQSAEAEGSRFRRAPLLIGALAGVVAAAVAVPVFALGHGKDGSSSGPVDHALPKLGFGDYVMVSGISVNCLVSPTAAPVGAIECYRTNASGIRPRSYSGFVSDAGAYVFYYDGKLKYHHVYDKDNPPTLPVAAVKAPANPRNVGAEGRAIGASQTLRVLNTHVRCRTSKPSPHLSVTCFYADTDGEPAARSYAIVVDKAGVTLAVVTANGRLRPVDRQLNP